MQIFLIHVSVERGNHPLGPVSHAVKSEGVSTCIAQHGDPAPLGQPPLLDEPRPDGRTTLVWSAAKGKGSVQSFIEFLLISCSSYFIIITLLCQDKDHGNTTLLGPYEDGKPVAWCIFRWPCSWRCWIESTAICRIKSRHSSFQVLTAFKMRWWNNSLARWTSPQLPLSNRQLWLDVLPTQRNQPHMSQSEP